MRFEHLAEPGRTSVVIELMIRPAPVAAKRVGGLERCGPSESAECGIGVDLDEQAMCARRDRRARQGGDEVAFVRPHARGRRSPAGEAPRPDEPRHRDRGGSSSRDRSLRSRARRTGHSLAPAARQCSPASSQSSMVAAMPRLSSTGRFCSPSLVAGARSSACCESPTWMRSAPLATALRRIVRRGLRSRRAEATGAAQARHAATIEDWLLAGEHCLAAGASDVLFWRARAPRLRSLDEEPPRISVPWSILAEALRLPVIVDPSHAAGRTRPHPRLVARGDRGGRTWPARRDPRRCRTRALRWTAGARARPTRFAATGAGLIMSSITTTCAPARARCSIASPDGTTSSPRPVAGDRCAWRRRAARAIGAGEPRPSTWRRAPPISPSRSRSACRVHGSSPVIRRAPARGGATKAPRASSRRSRSRDAWRCLRDPSSPIAASTRSPSRSGFATSPTAHSALAEMARVTRDGGRVVILELTEPRAGLFAPLARLHVHVLVPWLGALLSGAPSTATSSARSRASRLRVSSPRAESGRPTRARGSSAHLRSRAPLRGHAGARRGAAVLIESTAELSTLDAEALFDALSRGACRLLVE